MATRKFDAFAPKTLLQSFEVSDGYLSRSKPLKELARLTPDQRTALQEIFQNERMDEDQLKLDENKKKLQEEFQLKIEDLERQMTLLLTDPNYLTDDVIAAKTESLWRRLYKIVQEPSFTLTHKSITVGQEALQRIWDLASKKKYKAVIGRRDLLEGLNELNTFLLQKESRTIYEVKLSDMRKELWAEYQRQLLTMTTQQARLWLKTGLLALKELAEQQTQIFGRTMKIFAQELNRAGNQPWAFDPFTMYQFLQQEGLDLEVVEILKPVCQEMLLSHNRACQVYDLGKGNGKDIALALKGNAFQFQGRVAVVNSSPFLAVTLFFSEMSDYTQVYNHVARTTRAAHDIREAGVSFNTNVEFIFHYQNS